MYRQSSKLTCVLYFLMLLAVLLSFSACVGESSDSDDDDDEEEDDDEDDNDGDNPDGDAAESSEEGSDGDSPSDGDSGGSVTDGDNNADGDSHVDGDDWPDGDEPSDGDDVTDGDDWPDGDEPADGDSDVEAEEENPPTIKGYISLWETNTVMNTKGTSSQTVSISASFYENSQSSGNEPIEVGQCKIYPYDSNSTTVTVLDAGRITVTGATITPVYADCENYKRDRVQCVYYFDDFYQLDNLYDPGDNISAEVEGNGNIPAFDLSLSALADISGLNPNILANDYSYEAGSPLSFTWNAGEGMLTVSIVAYVYSGYQILSGYTIFCYTEDDGSFSVPSDALEYLSSSSNYISVSVSRQASVTDRKGDVETTLSIGTQKTRVWSNAW